MTLLRSDIPPVAPVWRPAADASASVVPRQRTRRFEASIGLRFGFLLPSGIGLLAGGGLLLAFALVQGRKSP
jgi:hypothetical protein